MIEKLIELLLPELLKEVESKIDIQPGASQVWISQVVNDVVSVLQNSIPSLVKPALPEIQKLVEDGIAALVDKL